MRRRGDLEVLELGAEEVHLVNLQNRLRALQQADVHVVDVELHNPHFFKYRGLKVF